MSPASTATSQPGADRCIFTICTRSYIGLANALGASMRDRGVVADYVIVVVDGDVAQATSPFGRIVSAVELCGYEAADWTARTFKYDLVELCTSIKARCFQALFAAGHDKVIYFDPDIIVFDDLEAVFAGLDDHDVIATPHRLAYDSDMAARGGVFNIGFLAARNGLAAGRVMAWWDARLDTRSLNDPLRGFFTDQKWMDHLPVLLREGRLLVSGHPGMNLAPWNLGERALHRRGEGWVASLRGHEQAALPLSFVHFSAFDYGLLTEGKSDARSGETVAMMPEFSGPLDVLTEYLKRGGFLDHASIPYEYATYSDGRPILPGHRRIYLRLLERGDDIADPFSADGAFHRTLRENRLLADAGVRAGGKTVRGRELTAKLGRAAKVLDTVSRLAVRVLGYPRYAQMSKLLVRYFHTNNHVRLIRRRDARIDVEYF